MLKKQPTSILLFSLKLTLCCVVFSACEHFGKDDSEVSVVSQRFKQNTVSLHKVQFIESRSQESDVQFYIKQLGQAPKMFRPKTMGYYRTYDISIPPLPLNENIEVGFTAPGSSFSSRISRELLANPSQIDRFFEDHRQLSTERISSNRMVKLVIGEHLERKHKIRSWHLILERKWSSADQAVTASIDVYRNNPVKEWPLGDMSFLYPKRIPFSRSDWQLTETIKVQALPKERNSPIFCGERVYPNGAPKVIDITLLKCP